MNLIQEIKDLFARNSGDYDPTCQEVENIDAGLEHLLRAPETPPGKIDLEELDAKRLAAQADKADLFDFYHDHFDRVLAELRAHRDAEDRKMRVAEAHLNWHAKNTAEAYRSYE